MNGHNTLAETREKNQLQATIDFLSAISKNGGADADDLIAVFGLRSGRGIGGSLLPIKRILKENGFGASEVFEVRKDPLGKRWIAGRKADEALKKLKL